MRRKQLLFSKREKAEKSTTMGEDNENASGNLGLPNNNEQMPETIMIKHLKKIKI